MPSVMLSLAPLSRPSPEPSLGLAIASSPVEVSESGSTPNLDDGIMLNPSEGDDREGDNDDDDREDNDQEGDDEGGDREVDDEEDNGLDNDLDKAVNLEDEEDNADNFMEVSRCEPKARDEIHGWPELRDQIMSDIKEAHNRQASLKHINQLLVLWNFTMLQIQGDGRILASIKIVEQLKDSVGTYFACQIRFLARYYQLFEKLPPEKQGKYMNRSLLSDKQV